MAALESVLENAKGSYDRIVNCGDLVGYGPDPNEVIDWCRATPQIVVRGNHDKACVGLADLEWFNATARTSAVWTHTALREDNREFLMSLPRGPLEMDRFEVFHGSPDDEDEYLLDRSAADAVKGFLSRGLAFFGHTHVQGGFLIHRTGTQPILTGSVTVDESAGYMMNPGSVGQPRDYNRDAAYAIYDEANRRVDYRRAPYDIDRTYRRIVELGLPEILGRRLYVGT